LELGTTRIEKIMSSSPYRYSPSNLVKSYQEAKVTLQAKPLLVPQQETATSRSPSSSSFVVAATQITGAGLEASDIDGYIARAEQAIVQGIEQGAQLILLPELWCGPYFCQSQEATLMALADPVERNALIMRMQSYAKAYNVVLPISFFEQSNNTLYNSVVMLDADGTNLGSYRKSHIPDGTGYQEKFYFSPGDTGFKVFSTKVGRVGVAICWDQWFPEAARAMSLQGADVLLYPTAIGSEPQDPTINSADHWQRVMQGHAAANMVPVVASNRYGTEILCQDKDNTTEKQRINFYGRSFITNQTGEIMAECSDLDETNPVQVITSTIDPAASRTERLAWGLFRDRRPDLYGPLLTKDGAGAGRS
jgi:N-carbamoylputrescine amidase